MKLFDRNTRNVELTAPGAMLIPIVERLTSDYDDAFAELALTFAGRRGRVTIGVLPSYAATVLPMMLRRFHQNHPQVDVIVRDGLSDALYDQMRQRGIDLAVTTPGQGDDTIHFEPLLTDDCVLVHSAQWQQPTAQPKWSIFANHPFLAMSPGSSVRALTDAAFLREGLMVKPLYECTHLTTMGGLIAADLGITALPMSTVPMLGAGVAWTALGGKPISRTIGLAWPVRRSLSPAADALRKLLIGSVDQKSG